MLNIADFNSDVRNTTVIAIMAQKKESVIFGLSELLLDLLPGFPHETINEIEEFTQFRPETWSSEECYAYFSNCGNFRIRKENFTLSGEELGSLTFQKLERICNQKTVQYEVVDIIRRYLLGPKFNPYDCAHPQPGGKTECIQYYFFGITWFMTETIWIVSRIVFSPLLLFFFAYERGGMPRMMAWALYSTWYGCTIAAGITQEPLMVAFAAFPIVALFYIFWHVAFSFFSCLRLMIRRCKNIGANTWFRDLREFHKRNNGSVFAMGALSHLVFAICCVVYGSSESKWDNSSLTEIFGEFSDWGAPMLTYGILHLCLLGMAFFFLAFLFIIIITHPIGD